MFGGSRRRRPPVQPLTSETANPNAATAAASAFMRSEPSNSLSSAAAAAALKARPTTPTNVAEVQSKRALRRSASATRSPDRSRHGKQLQRSPSASSMTERTFRSPSPGRNPAPVPHDAPPVPSLPKTEPQKQSFRTTNQRTKHGSGNISIRTTDLVSRTSTDANDARPGSISPSINFSYPRATVESPTLSAPSSSEVTMVYDPNSRRMVPKLEIIEKQHHRRTPEKPAKKKKQVSLPVGSHVEVARALVAESLDREQTRPAETSKTQRAAVTEGRAIQPAKSAQPVEIKHQGVPAVESNASNAEPPPRTTTSSEAEVPSPAPNAPRSFPLKVNKSSLKTDGEDGTSNNVDSSSAQETDRVASAVSAPTSDTQVPTASSEDRSQSQEPVAAPIPEPRGQAREVRRTRVESQSPSHSPARSAHFAPTTAQLLVRHEPPPRSISPRKSALKQSNSVRGSGPSDDSSEASGSVSGQYSRDSSVQATKKAFRVSFTDENTVVVGDSAEPREPSPPALPSPQAKKPWHNVITRHQKKDRPVVDEGETMSPRPALPLFGSVRDKKPREPDNERPLVRPSEKIWSPGPGPEASILSNDSPVGSLSAQENASRNAANISKAREPLPPVVQSVDMIDYLSNSPSSSDDELDDSDTARSTQLTEQHYDSQSKEDLTQPPRQEAASEEKSSVIATDSKSLDGNGHAQDGSPVTNQTLLRRPEDVPMISITNPSPLLKDVDDTSPASDYFDVPGGFPEDGSSAPVVAGNDKPSLEIITQPSKAPALAEVEEAPVPGSPMGDIKEEEESTDGSSIYSDAYEDLSDIEGDGFMSLDAVLESPTSGKMAKIYEKALSQAKENETAATSISDSGVPEVSPKTSQDWENAKAYWRSLSSDKRRQLEVEAMEEAAEEADQEAPSKVKKTKKKRRSADRQALIAGAIENSQVVDGSHRGPKVSTREDAPVKPFRKSMRGNQPQELGEPQRPSGSMRKSLRSNGDAGDSHTTRPSSYHPGSTTEPSNDTKRSMILNGRPASSGGIGGASGKPTLRRRGSDSSESSFKRSRRGNAEGFGFRRSMREPEPQHSSKGSGRFSLRSLSPPGSPFRRPSFQAPASTNTGGRGMKQSLRSDSTDTKHKRFSSIGRSSGKKAKQGKLGSRFADSSDEEDARPSIFRSRFADSSDEDDRPLSSHKQRGFAKTMRTSQGASSAAAAALGVPPAQPRADSPDLPDSDDEIVQPKRGSSVTGNGRPPVQRNRSGRGELASNAGLIGTDGLGDRPSHTRKNSFMSSILRRKKSPGNKITREINESAARRDTRLERSTEELAMIRSNSGSRLPTQKRGPSWPLPDGGEEGPQSEPKAAAEAPIPRPATSSGAGPSASSRGFLKRRSLSHQEVPPYVPPYAGQEQEETPSEVMGKKKKFGTLRKMFGLND
ncbi:unnamed protein product [Clonostachys byssicola]|uniref:Uncharacterized protein n=1 Tax=Clonostachys byssicola TaxID=160290 RepID=A0A9N9UM33_9HYPO|nr:unnamed protein product [Clonostachys byssicola]